ncbi:ribonuclease H family protein [Vreelandella rituensis]|uniref:Ribonuclease H n=1 Tax=Vreelandella rituensis TaxID=2282306 RepID=A0A368TVP7_9GAMM|nr:ribonuclease H family protein [Halomonas rituensis]RCV88728.1 ribonuclease HI [Halomonas rituensis]
MATAKKPKWYVVWEGRTPGVYTTWADCQKQTKGFPKAKFKSYLSKGEAHSAFQQGWGEGGWGKADPTEKGVKGAGDNMRHDASVAVDVEIFCDGACDPNPGPAGSGLAVYRQGILDSLYLGHYTLRGTNNTAELHALHEAFKLAKGAVEAGESVRIRADSRYAIQCVSQWASGWKKRGWKRPNGDPVKNPDIIAPAHDLYLAIASKITLNHVKAHAGIEGNELADRMAMLAAIEKEERFVRYVGNLDVGEVLKFKRG